MIIWVRLSNRPMSSINFSNPRVCALSQPFQTQLRPTCPFLGVHHGPWRGFSRACFACSVGLASATAPGNGACSRGDGRRLPTLGGAYEGRAGLGGGAVAVVRGLSRGLVRRDLPAETRGVRGGTGGPMLPRFSRTGRGGTGGDPAACACGFACSNNGRASVCLREQEWQRQRLAFQHGIWHAARGVQCC